MSDGRTAPRVGIVFDDDADLALLIAALDGLDSTQRALELRYRLEDARTRLQRKRKGRSGQQDTEK